jgi:hypothetical protein
MHPYIPHLLEDIAAAHGTEQPPESPANSLQNIIEELHRFDEAQYTLGYYCGLDAGNFPPPEQLLKKDMKLVCIALKKMMLSWNLKCHLPKRLPPDRAYTLLITMLDEPIDPLLQGMIEFNFCSTDPSDCLLKEYCTCKDNKPSDDDDESMNFIQLR